MFSWITNLFKYIFKQNLDSISESTSESVSKPEEDGDSGSNKYFYTDMNFNRYRRNLSIGQYIKDNAFQVTHDQIKLVDGNHEGVAMDSSAMESAKNAFVLGQQRLPQNLFAWYVSQGFIGYQACGIIGQQWLVSKACSIKGRDAVRKGYTITVNDGSDISTEIISDMVKSDKKYKVKKNLCEADTFKEIFGIRHILFVVDSPDEDYYEKPFNPDGILPGSYKGISQVDPNWITPYLASQDVYDPASIDFYEPTYWSLSGKKYHKSHFIILRGPEVADILKPSYIYGGIPLTQRIMERVYGGERTANEGPLLAMTKRLNIRRLDMEKAMANQKALEEAVAFQIDMRDNHGYLFADTSEEIQQLETALADLDVTIMTQYQLVAAEANVPATKLLGTSPKGFNATGDHEIKTYHEELESVQENDLSPILERHHVCLIRSYIMPKYGIPSFETEVNWNPLDAPSAKELAEINQLKSNTDIAYMNTGAIDAYDIRDKIIGDPDSGYDGLEEVERPEEDRDYLDPPLDLDTEGPPETQEQPEPTNVVEAETVEHKTTAVDFVRQESDGWYVYSESGKKLGGPYSNKKKANNRLRQIEYFKHKG